MHCVRDNLAWVSVVGFVRSEYFWELRNVCVVVFLCRILRPFAHSPIRPFARLLALVLVPLLLLSHVGAGPRCSSAYSPCPALHVDFICTHLPICCLPPFRCVPRPDLPNRFLLAPLCLVVPRGKTLHTAHSPFQAWDIYFHVFRKISRSLPTLKRIELRHVAPALRNAHDLQLAVPGTYR